MKKKLLQNEHAIVALCYLLLYFGVDHNIIYLILAETYFLSLFLQD